MDGLRQTLKANTDGKVKGGQKHYRRFVNNSVPKMPDPSQLRYE